MMALTTRWGISANGKGRCASRRSLPTVRLSRTPQQTRRVSRICRSAEDGEEAVTESAQSEVVDANLCQGCGVNLSEAPNGCDREGHIASGLGALVGFEWWPIKVYRPCPAYEASGKVYVRKGQITNEILFRRNERSEI